jgi:hypothetical protein
MNNKVFSNQRKSASANSGTDQYYQKYLKYKQKYLSLVKKIGGAGGIYGPKDSADSLDQNTKSPADFERIKREREEDFQRRIREETAIDTQRKKDEVEQLRIWNEHKAKRREEKEEAKRIAREDAEREAKRIADEESKRIADEAKRIADEESKRIADEEAKRIADEAKRIEDEAKRIEDEAKRIADEETKRKKDEIITKLQTLRLDASICKKTLRGNKKIKKCSDIILQFNDCIDKEIEFVKNYSLNLVNDQKNRYDVILSMHNLMTLMGDIDKEETILVLYNLKASYYNSLNHKTVSDTFQYFLDHEAECESSYIKTKDNIEKTFK